MELGSWVLSSPSQVRELGSQVTSSDGGIYLALSHLMYMLGSQFYSSVERVILPLGRENWVLSCSITQIMILDSRDNLPCRMNCILMQDGSFYPWQSQSRYLRVLPQHNCSCAKQMCISVIDEYGKLMIFVIDTLLTLHL